MAGHGLARPGEAWLGKARGGGEATPAADTHKEVLWRWQFGRTTIQYAEIEAVTGLAWRSPRFKSVMNKWRRILFRELNIDTDMEAGTGMRVLAPGERIDASHRDMRSAIRKTRKGFMRINSVPTEKLTEIERKKYDHTLRSASMAYTTLTAGEKQLTDALKEPRQLPRRDAGSKAV